MIRIVALNEECNDGPEDQTVVTKEAQEAIAETEYLKAINLKWKGDVKSALSLLNQLLETQVLNELLAEDTSGKLRIIRYNCHKNIAFIYEETNEYDLALEHYVMATQLDDKDVYTMHRFGQLALKLNATELAEFAFESCLRCNASHWSAADGMLRTLCENHNVIGAYGYALKLYNKDPSHERAGRTLCEIADIFKSSLPLCENIYGPIPKSLKPSTSWSKGSVFPRKYRDDNLNYNEESTSLPSEISQKICIKELNWVSVGQYITALYRYMQENDKVLIVLLSLKDILGDSKHVNETEKVVKQDNGEQIEMSSAGDSNNSTAIDEAVKDPECSGINVSSQTNTNLPITTAPSNDVEQTKNVTENLADETESCEKTNSNSETNKPKPRRRCSDLHFLEQWGWHKTRRYNSRKKTTTERVEVDTSLKGTLRRIFAKYSIVTFEDEWPFGSNNGKSNKSNDEKCCSCKRIMSKEEFQETTRETFNELIGKIESKSLDPPLLVFEWLKSISSFWTKGLPEDVRVLYLKIFTIYLDIFDCSPWNQQSVEDIEIFYRISILFLELDLTVKNCQDNDLDPIWKQVFDQLAFRSGTALVALGRKFNQYKLRLINLEYIWFYIHNDFEKCIDCLTHIDETIALFDDKDFILHLPNLNAKCITENVVKDAESDFKRRIALAKIPKLFEQENWHGVVEIITNNLANEIEIQHCENWLKNLKTQIEILLESLWNMLMYEECLKWAEKCLHYCINKYMKEKSKIRQQELWAVAVNFVYSYIEVIILNEGSDIVLCLDEMLARLVQNTISVLSFHFDSNQTIDKITNTEHELNMKRPFVILHQIILRDENNQLTVVKAKTNNNGEQDEEDPLPSSFSLLFTAHDFLGKYQYCTRNNGEFLHYILDIIVPIIRAPLYDSCRDTLCEYIEQATFCLYGYPQKKARSRHLEDHEATNVDLTWAKAIQAFDLYRPECLPEINSYKLESITADLEQFFLKIVAIMPTELDPTPQTTKILEFIKGNDFGTLAPAHTLLPYKIRSIFYLLADYYFKNRDFSKAIKYYTLDLTISPTRFDSWAGMALSKASKIETRLNCLNPLNPNNILAESEDTIRCFEMCICLNRRQTLFWIEYGSFTYTLYSYCSRQLKNPAENLTAELSSLLQARKGRVLNISHNCFSLAAALQNSEESDEANEEDNEDSHEEKWLCQYMLGKIAEKQNENPKIYLNFYLQAANNLYESNATYPIKINHSNPTTLSVEALEVFYRTNASIIKFLAQQKEISRDIGNHLTNVLKSLASSPFAFNKAKIDGNSLNALKRKVIIDKNEQAKILKTCKKPNYDTNCNSNTRPEMAKEDIEELKPKDESTEQPNKPAVPQQAQEVNIEKASGSKINPSRRESEESGVTVTTTTITSSTTSATTSSTDTSSTETDSDSDGSSNDSKKLNTPYPAYKIDNIYKMVIQNLEECVTRFPEHYKSIYRLAYHYKNTHLPNFKNLQRCEELLLGQYKTSLENQIDGVFYDRKWNNIFNGIWRLPSSEIDRPGNFSSHLVKCAAIVIELLFESKNHKLLIDIGLQLYKTPEQDKRYIKDCERVKLSQRALNYCAQLMRDILKGNIENRNDIETLNLLIDIYKVHKKCLKYMNQKELLFTELMVDVYKFYIQNKVENVPDNLNFFDLAIKLCLHEIAARRNQEKVSMSEGDSTSQAMFQATQTLAVNPKPKQIHIPGLTMRQRGRSSLNKSIDAISVGGVENVSNMSNVMQIPTSFNESIWLHLLRSQYPTLDMQQIVEAYKPFVDGKQHDQFFMKEMIDQYKSIFQTIQNEHLINTSIAASSLSVPPIPISTNPIFSSINNLAPTLPANPIFLSTALPMETTITPSISKAPNTASALTPISVAQAQALANYDITITPFCNLPTSMNLPIVSSVETNTKPVTTSVINPTETNFASPFIYNPCIVSSSAPQQIQPTNFSATSSVSSGSAALQNNLKETMANKLGGTQLVSVANTPIVNPLATFTGSDLYNQQMQMQILMNMMQDANNYQQQQQQQMHHQIQQQVQQQLQHQQNFTMPPQQKARAAPKRKAKQTPAPTNNTISPNILPNIITNSTSMQIPKQEPLCVPTTAILNENHPLFCPTIDINNAAAINQFAAAISQGNTIINQQQQQTLPTTAPSFSPSQTSPQKSATTSQPTTPTKTLQQKLAERKKANQQNDINLNENTEIIILD